MNRSESMLHKGTVGGLVIVSMMLSACGITPPAPLKPRHDPMGNLPSKVQSLQRQLRERDRRIAELEAQLEALKLIDQDDESQKRLALPPMMRTPVP